MKQYDLLPDPLSSDRQYYRFHHLDIPQLEDDELTDEFYALRPLLWRLPADHWLRERVWVLQGEMKRRGYSVKYSKDTRSKPQLAMGVKL